MWRRDMRNNIQQGQAVTEFLIAWPIIIVAICFVVQLLWLWWAQQTLHTATQYAVRSGAINHGSHAKMRNTLVLVMAGIKPQLAKDKPMSAAVKAVAEQGAHYALYGRVKTVQPTHAHYQRFAKQRWDSQLKRYVKEIAVDHYHARQAVNGNDDWIAARQLKIETQWCEDLRIPLAAEFLSLIAKRRGLCLLGNTQGRPQWPLNSSAIHEMLSGYRRR